MAEEALAEELEEDTEESERLEPLPLVASISAVLFVSGKPLSTEKIARAVRRTDVSKVEAALLEIKELYQEEIHGITLEEIGGKWQLRSSPRAKNTIQRLIPARARILSRAASETLAVIAYKQPVQKSEIEDIRGVDALPTLKTLLDARLVRVIGHEDTAGQPALYGTTQTFLEKFGLRDLADLPSVREIEELMNEPGELDEDSNEEVVSAGSDDLSWEAH